MRALGALLALALSLAAVPAARADELADAKASFRRGVELFKEKRWKEAMEEFQAAYRAKPHGALHFNVAQCRERLDDWPGAIRSYRDYLHEVPNAADKDVVNASVKRLEEKLGKVGVQVLLLDSTPAGAFVVIEGLDRGRTPLHVVLQPGPYAVAIALDGYVPWMGKVEMGRAESVVVDASLKPAPPGSRAADLAVRPPGAAGRAPAPVASPAPFSRRQLPAWIAMGTAVVATAAAVAYNVSAKSDEHAIDALSTPDPGGASAKARSAASKRRTAYALYGLAGGAAVTGGTLFMLEWKF
jgi:tetratricopeptide (TPR) repeat protein